MPGRPDTPSPAEAELQQALHAALTRAHDVLVDCPDITDVDGEASVDALEERFDELTASIVESACIAADMQALELSREGASIVGSAEVALAALRATLASMTAALDVARDAA